MITLLSIPAHGGLFKVTCCSSSFTPELSSLPDTGNDMNLILLIQLKMTNLSSKLYMFGSSTT